MKGKGPQCCSELKMCWVKCPGSLQGRNDRASPQYLPGWDPNTSCPLTQGMRRGSSVLPALFPLLAGSRGVKVLAALGWWWQEQGVEAPAEARMTPKQPWSSLAWHGPGTAREAPGWAGVCALKQQHLSGAMGSRGMADRACQDGAQGRGQR